ncbi:hypothetical protein BGZ89_003562 [Linnemannia elongata]|nr:hypothetical protein BGZ89_003562 [Linnemannia elongata]
MKVGKPGLSLSSENPDLLTDEAPTTPVVTVLIGDSILERLKTTGTSAGLAKLSGSFNVGCGGDKIGNVLHHLDLMYPLLQNCRDIKLWIVMVGTNNLRKKGFRPADVALYRLLLQALLRIAPRSKVLACEMFRGKDIKDRYADEANRMVKEMIKAMNDTLEDARILWCEAPEDVTKEMFEDHVHLVELGYSRWDGHILPRVQELLLEP